MLDFKQGYDSLFNKHLVLITGYARGGTSLIEHIIGSMEGCYSIYEPVCFPNIITLMQKQVLDYQIGKELLLNILFEDFFLNRIHGRYVNFNKKDESYIGNYCELRDIEESWNMFHKRKDVMNYLKTNKNYKFIIKNPNLGPLLDFINRFFLDIKIIIVTRDIKDVVGSCKKKGFYNEDYMNVDCWHNWIGRDFEGDDLYIPWYVDDECFLSYDYDKQVRIINNIQKKFFDDFLKQGYKNVYHMSLEDFRMNPMFYIEEIEKFLGVKHTCKTVDVVKSMECYKQEIY